MSAPQRGFTLIELMIVVAIVGIITAIAAPAYQNYISKSQLGRALGEIAAYRSAVEEAIGSNRSVSNAMIGYRPSPLTTGTVGVDIASTDPDGSGQIEVTLGGNVSPRVAGVVVRLERDVDGRWSCVIDPSSNAGWRNSFLPTGCMAIE